MNSVVVDNTIVVDSLQRELSPRIEGWSSCPGRVAQVETCLPVFSPYTCSQVPTSCSLARGQPGYLSN